MQIYLLVFFIALLYYIIAQGKYANSNGLLVIFFGYVAIFIGLGDMIGGYDRYIYGEVFDTIADETASQRNYINEMYLVEGNEYGYFLWQIVCSYITENRYVYILLTTLLMYALYFNAFRNYITNYPLGCIIFLGLFYYFTITYTRQVLACGFAWQGIRYIWKRKFWHFFFFVLLAYSFHNSAIIFVLMYFIPIRKYKKSTVIFVLLFCLALGFTSLPTVVMSSSGGERTADYEDQMNGFRADYIIEAVFFVSLFFVNYKKISNDRRSLTFLNMGFVFCAILLIFMRFGQGGRFGWYFLMGIIYTLTTLSTSRIAYRWMPVFVVGLSFSLFLRITTLWSFNLMPYKTFFTDGLPSGNKGIYEHFEYNEDYTIDKFCRPAFTFIDDKN